jgi:hypothetical protein
MEITRGFFLRPPLNADSMLAAGGKYKEATFKSRGFYP